MMKTNVKLLFFATLFAFASCGDSTPDDSKEVAEETNEQVLDNTNIEKDAEFAVAAADGGMMEVELGRLAQTNASSAAVKEFGDMMVKDHGAANEELKAAAGPKNITLPASLSEENQKTVADLSAKKGAEFDKEYMGHMVDDHEKAIRKFQNEADNGNDPDLKAWAAGKVPTLQAHLERAKTIKDGLK